MLQADKNRFVPSKDAFVAIFFTQTDADMVIILGDTGYHPVEQAYVIVDNVRSHCTSNGNQHCLDCANSFGFKCAQCRFACGEPLLRPTNSPTDTIEQGIEMVADALRILRKVVDLQ
jgi:hypothetical protein